MNGKNTVVRDGKLVTKDGVKLLMGIKCKCAKGHTWNCAAATIWVQMPYCPKCYKEDYKGINHLEHAVSWQGLWQEFTKKDLENECKKQSISV